MSGYYIPLPDRHVFTIEGDDASNFLQGLITNDIRKVTDNHSIYACMLTAQGKYLFDMFISQWQGKYFLDIGTLQPEAILRKLMMYKLRSKVTIANVSTQYKAIACIGSYAGIPAEEGNTAQEKNAVYYVDPRMVALGVRAIVKDISTFSTQHNLKEGEYSQYETSRLMLGVADGVRDLVAESSFPLPFGMEALHAIDFNKGCYVGQEVTARSKHRGSIKKGIFRIRSTSSQPLPEYGTVIVSGTMKIGEMLSSIGDAGLALLRLEELEKSRHSDTPLQAGEIHIVAEGH